MHGGISLTSELGVGTTTKFWIPFNKPHSTKFSSPDLAARSIPERFGSEKSIPGCPSASQSVNGDVAHDETLSGLSGGIGPGVGPVPPEEGSSEDSVQQEVDRKNIHILVVEDKYVVVSSCARTVPYFQVRSQPTDFPFAVLSTSRSLSRQSKNSDSLLMRCGMARKP